MGRNASQFYVPHSLALDHRRGLLYVADRENGRVQAFKATPPYEWVAQLRGSLAQPMTPYAVAVWPPPGVIDAAEADGSLQAVAVNGILRNSESPAVLHLSTPNVTESWGGLGARLPHDLEVAIDESKSSKKKKKQDAWIFVADISLNTIHKYIKAGIK